MRTLVLCDDFYHPAHTVRAGLSPLEGRGETFDWIEHARDWSAERMWTCSAVILSKMNHRSSTDQHPWIDDHVQGELLRYVNEGNGLLVIHSGAAGYEQLPVLRGLAGGAFTQHPPQCSVTVELRAEHALAAGAAQFAVHDEHYFMDLDDPEADVFMTTVSEHGTQPGGWTRTQGAGRVCLLTPGHNADVWLHPSYQTVLRNALAWCHNKPAT